MAVSARTIFTQSFSSKIPYYYICNYCGERNDELLDISGNISQTVDGAVRNSLDRELAGCSLTRQASEYCTEYVQVEKGIVEEYAKVLREGRKITYTRFGAPIEGPDWLPDFGSPCCKNCGKKQVWSIDPSSPPGEFKIPIIYWGITFLIAAAFLGLAVLFSSLNKYISMALCVSVLGTLLAGYILQKKAQKRNLEEFRARLAMEPNDPDKLPVL